MKPADFRTFGFTQGCPGCTFAQTNIGPKRNHSEACRKRMEEEIVKDEADTRISKAQDRQEHFMAKKVEEGKDKDKRDEDPRHGGDNEPKPLVVENPAGVNEAQN